MSLASKLAFQVPRGIQTQGYRLHSDGGLRVVKTTPNTFSARVLKGGDHQVDLRFEDGILEAECDCDPFLDDGICKHIWAAILEADRHGSLVPARKAAHLVLGPEMMPDDLEWVFEDLPRFRTSVPPPRMPLWTEQLESIAQQAADALRPPQWEPWPAGFEVCYILDLQASLRADAPTVATYSRSRKKNGEWTALKELRLAPNKIAHLPDATDVELVSLLHGGMAPYSFGSNYYVSADTSRVLPVALALKTLPAMAALGRLLSTPALGYGPVSVSPLTWDDGEPWRFYARIGRNKHDRWQLTGELRRGEERLELSAPQLILREGFLLHGGVLARFEDVSALPWIRHLQSTKTIEFPDRDRDQALTMILASPVTPRLDLDKELQFEERAGQPKFGVLLKPTPRTWEGDKLDATLLADYGTGFIAVQGSAVSGGLWLPEQRVYIRRNTEAETEATGLLRQAGVRPPPGGGAFGTIPTKDLPKVARKLVALGWHVEAQGRVFRRPGAHSFEVTSGVDWFELRGAIDYDGEAAALPELLAALRRGDGMVRLGDGSFGMLPEDWLRKFAPLAGLGSAEEDHLRFRPNQAGLLDVLLAAQPEVRVDEVFKQARERLRTFHGVQSAPQPEGFSGRLRKYQLEGLGWIGFLRDFGFGGILADDMGVGKTAQVLAALEQRREGGHGTSLVVTPRSLLFNWRQEAQRFTPNLKVLEHAGAQRDPALIDAHHVVLTTYGTLQRDIAHLSEREFDYVVLDEAQAIKNASTNTAKAVRLLKGRHRLALSGTPVENHLGELWSLFEFLNPGMLGDAKVLKLTGGLARNPPEETRALLAAALRPFILRRTKKQVARELPEKTEQTIYCELEGEQHRKYCQLRDHYRARLLGKSSSQEAWNKNRMQVLEALLRLRQAACHPGLLDPKLAAEPGAKFTTLLAQLGELREEGHKALVFSQFTSLLALLRERLDEAGFQYEYLDGQTRDRQAHVERFQNDAQCQLFLISLRAGGLGLNLTAAGYVFLLDPWWNPAVEAQAIDRAHRIGQTQNVFAYRLIAKGTVEEKVLELQQSKRDLADAILSEDNRLLRDLKREDLELLLS